MSFSRNFTVGLALLACAVLPMTAHAADKACDRMCLHKLGDAFFGSMIAHRPGALPFATEYAATENGHGSAVPMMTPWRTVTAVKDKYYVIDPVTEQVFFVATVVEGPTDQMMFGRLKANPDGKLSEVEIYVDRARGDAGFQYGLDNGAMEFPTKGWTSPIAKSQKETRAALLNAGVSMFQTNVASPPLAKSCVMMENGKFSDENPKVLKYLLPSDLDIKKVATNAKGMDVVPCAAPPERPADKQARTNLVDEEQGTVVSIAMISGRAQPYLVTNPTISAFVPNDIAKPYIDLLKAQDASGDFKGLPRVRALPVTSVVAQIYRMYDGKIQQMMLLFNIEPYGATSAWVTAK